MGRYELDEYDEYEDEGEDEEQVEEEHKPTQEELKYLHMRQKLKESIRKKRKNNLTSGVSNSQESNNKMPYNNFGSFFGPSQPAIAQRVIQESKSLLENPHLAASVSKPKNTQNKSCASTSTVSKSQSQKAINLAKSKAKIQMHRETRDYSFLLSEDADLPAPKINPHIAIKPQVHPTSQRKPSNNDRKVINGVDGKKKQLPKKQLCKNDGNAPVRTSAPKASTSKAPMAINKKMISSSATKSSMPNLHKPVPPVHKKQVAQKPILSSKSQIKQPPPKRRVEAYSDDDDKAISMIRSMFRYNPSRYDGVNDDDDSDMEAGFDDIMMEEKRSARIAAKEDEEELRKIEEEEKREQMRKAAKKQKVNQR